MNGASEKRMQDRISKILRLMVTHGDNRYCFECRHRGPTYVDMTVGSFVCTSCGGALRKYSHRVKSFSMSNFSPVEIEFLCKRGNKACKKIYLATDDNSAPDFDVKANLDDYLRLKYQLKKWYRDPTSDLEAEAIAENQEIMNRAEQAETQKQNTGPGVNATAGLIIAPPLRPPPEHNNTAIARNSVNPAGAVKHDSGDLFIDEKIDDGKKSQAERDNGLSDVFNGFNDDLFNPPLNMLPSHSANTFPDLFSSTSGGFSGSAFAPAGWNSPQIAQKDLFRSFNSIPTGQSSGSFTSPPTVPAAQLATAAPANLTYLVNPFAGSSTSMSSAPTTDKYAALAELDDLFKVSSSNAGPGLSSVATANTAFTTTATSQSFSHWPSPSTVAASPLAFNFAFPAPSTVPPGNPFTPGSFRPPVHGALNPFETRATTTSASLAGAPAPTSAFLFPNPIAGPRNPFLCAPTAATTTTASVRPVLSSYTLPPTGDSQGKPGAHLAPGFSAPGLQSVPAGQNWAGLGAPNQAFWPPPANNPTVVGSTWANGASNTGGSNTFF